MRNRIAAVLLIALGLIAVAPAIGATQWTSSATAPLGADVPLGIAPNAVGAALVGPDASTCAQLLGPLITELLTDLALPSSVVSLLDPVLTECTPAAPAKPTTTTTTTTQAPAPIPASAPPTTPITAPPMVTGATPPPTPLPAPGSAAPPVTVAPSVGPGPATGASSQVAAGPPVSAPPEAPLDSATPAAASHGFQYPAILLLPLGLLALVGYLVSVFTRPMSTRR